MFEQIFLCWCFKFHFYEIFKYHFFVAFFDLYRHTVYKSKWTAFKVSIATYPQLLANHYYTLAVILVIFKVNDTLFFVCFDLVERTEHYNSTMIRTRFWIIPFQSSFGLNVLFSFLSFVSTQHSKKMEVILMDFGCSNFWWPKYILNWEERGKPESSRMKFEYFEWYK